MCEDGPKPGIPPALGPSTSLETIADDELSFDYQLIPETELSPEIIDDAHKLAASDKIAISNLFLGKNATEVLTAFPEPATSHDSAVNESDLDDSELSLGRDATDVLRDMRDNDVFTFGQNCNTAEDVAVPVITDVNVNKLAKLINGHTFDDHTNIAISSVVVKTAKVEPKFGGEDNRVGKKPPTDEELARDIERARQVMWGTGWAKEHTPWKDPPKKSQIATTPSTSKTSAQTRITRPPNNPQIAIMTPNIPKKADIPAPSSCIIGVNSKSTSLGSRMGFMWDPLRGIFTQNRKYFMFSVTKYLKSPKS